MAAGLVEEGMRFEEMEREIARLNGLLASSRPVCPSCKAEMKQCNFKGYYDEFSYWDCRCGYPVSGAEEHWGAYA